jgi:hypothetical protein
MEGALIQMKTIQKGMKMVFAIPKQIKPIKGLPHGVTRLKFRCNECAKAYVKSADSISEILLEDCGEYWLARPDLVLGINKKLK